MSEGTIPGQLLLDPDVMDQPAAFYRRLAQEAPVWRVGDTDVFAAASYEAVTQACRRWDDFSSDLRYFLYRDERGLPGRYRHRLAEEGAARNFVNADPPVHGQHKKIISSEFSPNRIAALGPQLVDMTRERVAMGLREGRIEFMSAVANPIPIDVVSNLIGLGERDTEALFKSAIVKTDMLAVAISREELEARLDFSTETSTWLFQQLQAAMASPSRDILGLLAAGVNGGEVDVMLAMTILETLFAAGGESTSSLIGNSVRTLCEEQELQQRLRSNPTLIPKFIEEMLRLESPFRYHMRFVTKDCELCGISIPAGATLLLLWGAANRDPAQFDRPDEIDLDRPRQHVGFGSGIHVCLGNTLARLEARVVIETLLADTVQVELQAGHRAQWVPNLAVRRLDTLPLTLTVH